VGLVESLTGAAPSAGFVHGLLARAAALAAAHDRIRALIGLCAVVVMDETPLRVGPRLPRPGRKKAERYLLVACTDLYTHFLLGDRDLQTFQASVLSANSPPPARPSSTTGTASTTTTSSTPSPVTRSPTVIPTTPTPPAVGSPSAWSTRSAPSTCYGT